MRRTLSLFYLLFLWSGITWAIDISQNLTVNASDPHFQYLPEEAWSFTPSPGTTNGTFAHTGTENATAVFNLTVPATAFVWIGYLPATPARYSVCIDCASENELGSIVTVDATQVNSTSSPVVLFASEPLDNTTHTVFLRNVRNSIEGVVGEMSVYKFIFTTDASVDSSPPSSVAPSKFNRGLTIAIAILAPFAFIVLATMAFLLCRYYRSQPRSPRTRSTKRDMQKGDVEAAPIMKSVSENKPLPTISSKRVSSKKLSVDVGRRADRATINGPNGSSMPLITVTSPTTVPTSASTYSTMPDMPSPRLPEHSVRQSDPYVSYAAAYASFAGVDEYEQPSTLKQSSALRESVTLPSLVPSLVPDEGMENVRSLMQNLPRPPPTSFSGGNRSGIKGKRTLSDKIRRGTLPPPPAEPRASMSSKRDSVKPASKSNLITVSNSVEHVAKASPSSSSPMTRPSFLPGLSSTSSRQTPSESQGSIADDVVERVPLPSQLGRQALSRTSKADAAPPRQHVDSVDQLVDAYAGIEPLTANDPILATLADTTSAVLASQWSLPSMDVEVSAEGDANSPISQTFPRAGTASIITTKTANTTRSSTSFTPSVSDFPMPPFNIGGTGEKRSGTSGSTPDDETNQLASRPSSTPVVTRSPSSTTGSSDTTSSRSGRVNMPPSVYPTRQRIPRAPPVKIAQLGLGVPLSAQTKAPIRRSSGKKGGKGIRTKSLTPGKTNPIAKLPFRGNVLPTSITSMKSQDTERDEAAESVLSLDTSESDAFLKGAVPFYMATLSVKRSNSTAESQEDELSLDPSRLTIGSTLTTLTATDEEYASGVQLAVATKGIPPNLPRSIKPPSPKLSVVTAASSPSGASKDNSPNNDKWEMILPKPPPPAILPIITSSPDTEYRPNGPNANVPVSAMQSEFEGLSVESSVPPSRFNPSILGTFGSSSWVGFSNANTPTIDIGSPVPSTTDGFTRSPMRPKASVESLRRDVSNSTSPYLSVSPANTTTTRTNSSEDNDSSPRKPSRASIIARSEPGWKDIVAAGTSTQGRSRSNSRRAYDPRLSTYSTASSFFGGTSTPIDSPPPPLPFPLDTPLPTPPAIAETGQSVLTNARQWNARVLATPMIPINQRQTGNTPFSVTNVFATSSSASSRPTLTIPKVDSRTARLPSASRYNLTSPQSPYSSSSIKSPDTDQTER